MISVAMTTYNGAKYITEQLLSIHNQTCQPDEVIICDDMSTDNTVELIQDFISKYNLKNYWKVYVNEEHMGFIRNFVRAISMTNGDMIFLSDQDDIFMKSKFEIMKAFFDTNDDCLVLNANYCMIDERSKKIINYRIHSPRRKTGKIDFKKYFYSSNYPGFSMAFKNIIREDLNKCDLEYCYGHDILINLLGINRNGCYQICDKLSQYRLHNSNTSGVGDNAGNINTKNRIQQKKKELEEYKKMIYLCKVNRINNIDINIVESRMEVLQERIECLQHKNLPGLIVILFKNNSYPTHTIFGDILSLLRS